MPPTANSLHASNPNPPALTHTSTHQMDRSKWVPWVPLLSPQHLQGGRVGGQSTRAVSGRGLGRVVRGIAGAPSSSFKLRCKQERPLARGHSTQLSLTSACWSSSCLQEQMVEVSRHQEMPGDLQQTG